MALIEAPYPAIVASITLPEPDLGDRRNLIADLRIHDMQDGSIRTIIRTAYKKRYDQRYKMPADSARELGQFLNKYSADRMLLDGKEVYLEQSTLPASFDERDFVSFNLRFREA